MNDDPVNDGALAIWQYRECPPVSFKKAVDKAKQRISGMIRALEQWEQENGVEG